MTERDDAEIHLTLRPSHVATTADVQAHGVRIVKGIRDADHGMRTFVMCDRDDNRIDVGQDL